MRSTRECRTSGRNSSSGVDCGMIATARTHCRPFHPKRGCTDPRISGLLHLLRTLSRVGAHLADLYWRGRFVKRDERRALALIRVAVENAPEHERIWIEEIYQNIYCGASQGTRQQADGIVARWRKIFSHPSAIAWGSAPSCSRSAPAAMARSSTSVAMCPRLRRPHPRGRCRQRPCRARAPPKRANAELGLRGAFLCGRLRLRRSDRQRRVFRGRTLQLVRFSRVLLCDVQ